MVQIRRTFKIVFSVILIFLFGYLLILTFKQKKKARRSLDLELQNFSIKFKVIIPTRSRPSGIGYKYLLQTFESLSQLSTFNVDYHVYAFSRSEAPPINNKHFTFVKLKENDVPDNKKILKQSVDWIDMMTEWKSKCQPNEIYLYLEDDFILCRYAMNHLLSIYFWANRHINEWMSIRTSFGFNGLFMQCRDIDSMIDVMKEKLKEKEYPVDYGIAEWWSKYLNRIARNHYTFRYNLFQHIGFVSSVGNDAHYQRNPKCYDSNSHKFNYYLEKFDNHNCQHFMFSPCDKPMIQKELQYRARDVIESSPILKLKEREFLMKKLKIKVFKGRRRNCHNICKENKMKCKEEYYPFINDCKYFQKNFGNCLCTSEIWYGDHYFGPMVQLKDGDPVLWNYGIKIDKCVILDNPDWRCSHSEELDVVKLCPCSRK